ncbi:MAG TPA: VCBS repeat-containing protein, partial [Polyangiaceae bacterium]|nr:VCBS repeat-containing protein [Polyangiaceae bacterium]
MSAPEILVVLKDRWEEAWLGSPAVADLEKDGTNEIIAPRANALEVWSPDGALKWRFDGAEGRIWSSPVVADFQGGPELEVAFAARSSIFLLDASGAVLPGFPVAWEDEIRSLAAGDIDADGRLDLVAAPAHGGPSDVMSAWAADGSVIAGFPPNQAGTSGCDDKCYLAGCYDQNVAVGDLDGDGRGDIVVGHDNAYASIHKGTGEAFDASEAFPAKKTPGVRYLHDLALAAQGYADDEETALQAHFTNTAPAIADLDEDGSPEV